MNPVMMPAGRTRQPGGHFAFVEETDRTLKVLGVGYNDGSHPRDDAR